MNTLLKISCLLFCLMFFLSGMAQDDVELIPPKKYKRTEFGGQATMISNDSSPYKAGGGIWMAYHQSLKSTSIIELGGQFEYNFMSSSSIYFDDGEDFFSNRGSVMRLNFVTSTHPFRFENIDIFQELYTGTVIGNTSSTYYVDEFDEDGSIQKLQLHPGWNLGAGLGFRFKYGTLKFIYHYSSQFKQVDVMDIYYNGKLVYPDSKAPLGAFNIYLGIVLD